MEASVNSFNIKGVVSNETQDMAQGYNLYMI